MNVFDAIYRTNAWSGTESRSGPGSGRAATETVAREIVGLVAELGITSVLDVGCGDGYWMPDLPGYVGVDVVASAVQQAQERHPDRDYRLAGVRDVEQTFDLAIVRDAIQHLPLAEGMAVLEAIRVTGSRWLLASTFVGGVNVDITTGSAYAPDLMAGPFWMGQPERLIFDGWDYEEGTSHRDPRKHLGLWPLRRRRHRTLNRSMRESLITR